MPPIELRLYLIFMLFITDGLTWSLSDSPIAWFESLLPSIGVTGHLTVPQAPQIELTDLTYVRECEISVDNVLLN